MLDNEFSRASQTSFQQVEVQVSGNRMCHCKVVVVIRSHSTDESLRAVMSSDSMRTQTVRLTIRQDGKISRWECGSARAYAAQSRSARGAGASLQLYAPR